MLTRTLLPATRAAAAMLSAVVMTRMSCPLHQLWQGVFRGHHHGIFFYIPLDVVRFNYRKNIFYMWEPRRLQRQGPSPTYTLAVFCCFFFSQEEGGGAFVM